MLFSLLQLTGSYLSFFKINVTYTVINLFNNSKKTLKKLNYAVNSIHLTATG